MYVCIYVCVYIILSRCLRPRKAEKEKETSKKQYNNTTKETKKQGIGQKMWSSFCVAQLLLDRGPDLEWASYTH